MSDPFGNRNPQPDKDENLDKKHAAEQGNDLPSLNLQETEQARGAGNAAANQRNDRDDVSDKSVPRLDLTISIDGLPKAAPLGGTTGFMQLRKGEETKSTSIERPIAQYKPLINEFLKNTDDETKAKKLNEAELRQIYRMRESLSNATNMQDALSDALHLARVYQHMRYIEEAKKAIDLSLGIDPDNYYGNQLFRELERVHPADLGVSAPAVSEQPLTKSNLRKRILNLTGGRVIVVGDLLIDELLEGKPERISREAPVLILEHVDTELIPGGGANTANNIAALGGVCHAIGVCGDDHYATQLEQLFEKCHITHSLVRDVSRPTTVKTRILSKSHSFKQQLLRLDRISHDKIDSTIENQIIDKLRSSAGNYSAIVLSDYRAGIMTDGLIRACRAVAGEKNLFLIVDAQDDFARFQNVSVLTPNQPDAEKALGYSIDSKEALVKAGEDLLLMTGAQALLITRGGEGMVLFQQNEKMVELHPFNKTEVWDVTGAGDTVVGTMALALVTGSSYMEAMALGNLAAGIVVRKPGTAVTSQKEMLEHLDALKLPE
ncbi:MAG TPA: PfkB family carbohydrate kinase [Candidatus Obscuribacterales bacterium]